MLKIKLDHILPLLFATLMPSLRLMAGSTLLFKAEYSVFQSWFAASLLLYFYWYFLWYLWDFRSQYANKKYLLRQLGILAGLILVFLLTHDDNPIETKWILRARMIFSAFLFLIIQFALKAQSRIARIQLEKDQLELENYKAQLQALQAQVNPHFLFNALNTLRSMVRDKSDNAEAFVMSLADFYRVTLKQHDKNTISLKEELDVLKSYFFLMKNRSLDSVQTNIDVDERFVEKELPGMALQIVVENCFKHNSMSSKKPLHIDVSITEDVYIEVCNNKQPKLDTETPSGRGLDMIRKKYKLLHVEHGIVVDDLESEFCVKLKLI